MQQRQTPMAMASWRFLAVSLATAGFLLLAAAQGAAIPPPPTPNGSVAVPHRPLKELVSPDEAVRAWAAGELGKFPHDPQILGALGFATRDPSLSVRAAATISLGKLGHPAADRHLMMTLRSADPPIRALAARMLGRGGAKPSSGVPVALGKQLRADPEPGVRVDCARSLGKLGASAAPGIPDLIKGLGDEHPSVGGAAEAALIGIGRISPNAVAGAAVGALGKTSGGTNWRAIRVLVGLGGSAVPDLQNALAVKKNPLVQTQAILALGGIGSAAYGATPDLVSSLADPSEEVRLAAAIALGKIGPKAGGNAAVALGRLLVPGRGAPDTLRQAAVEAIGQIGVPARGQTQVVAETLLQDSSSAVRRSAAEALAKVGAAPGTQVVQVRSSLAGALKDENAAVRSSSAAALGSMGRNAAAAVPDLVLALADADSAVPGRAKVALWRIGPPGTSEIPRLVVALRHASESVRYEATKALGRIGPPSRLVLPEIVAMLNDSDAATRAAAAGALGRLGMTSRNETVAPLMMRLGDTEAQVRDEVEAALVKLGAAAVPALALTLKGSDATLRERAATLLGRIGPSATDAIPGLAQALGDPSTGLQSAAKDALVAIGPSAIPALAWALSSGKDDAARNAVWVLGHMGRPGASSLMPLLAGGVPFQLQQRAMSGLVALKADAVPALMGALGSKDEVKRVNAIHALGRIGKPLAAGAKPALLTLSQSASTEFVRLKAREVASRL